jgi:uncharacterized repeat protein (TIGR04138 family)
MGKTPPTFEEAVAAIVRHDGRYAADAYQFVREALDHTVRKLKKPRTGPGRHVSGEELLDGAREYALRQFGPLAKTVLEHWGIRQCEDIGNIVFNMVQREILGRSEEDSIESFRNGFDFDEAFTQPFLPKRSRRGGNP